VLGWIADRYGRLNTLWACTTISALSVFCLWAPASTSAVPNELTKSILFVTFVILYGITSGVYVSLLPAVLFDLVGPVSHFGPCRAARCLSSYRSFDRYQQYFSSVNGVLYFLRGLGTLVGTPSTGALIKSGYRSTTAPPEGFIDATIAIGVLLAGSAMCVAWVRVEISRCDGWKWNA